jgi:RNA polymerase II subunit A-like phosphatase
MAQASPTELFLPQAFPFPIKIVALEATPADEIRRGTRLLTYSFVHVSKLPSADPETRFGTWDAAIEGTLDSWKLKPGDVLSRNRAREKPAVIIVEPCKHGIQLGGLCVLCGKDMTKCANLYHTPSSLLTHAPVLITLAILMPRVPTFK